MYPIPNNNDREWSEGDDEMFSDDYSSEVRDDYGWKRFPSPPISGRSKILKIFCISGLTNIVPIPRSSPMKELTVALLMWISSNTSLVYDGAHVRIVT